MTAVSATARPVSDLDRIRDAVLTGESGVHEARIAVALLLHPGLRGSRALESAAGLSRALVLDVVPETGESSALLVTRSRGSSAFRHSRPLQVVLRPRQSALHRTSIFSSKISWDRESGSGSSVDTSNTQDIRVEADQTDILRVLDPSLDLWSNREQPSVAGQRAGSHGWLLLLIYGLRPIEVTMTELAELWRLSTRGTRDAVDRLVAAGWLSRYRRGRKVVIVVDFSALPDLMNNEVYTWDDRASHRSQVRGLEVQRFARRRTNLGLRVWLTLRHRARKLAELPDGVCRQWHRLLARISEEQLYDMLSAAPGRLVRRIA